MPLNYNQIVKYISASRLKSYEVICNGNVKKTLKLYQTNLRLSQAFYPLLSLFEVILRNALDEQLKVYFKDNNWLITQQNGFMSDPALSYTDRKTGKKRYNHYLKNCVANIITDLGANATQGKIMAGLTFGFWTSLFDKTHYKILNGIPIQIYSNLPPATNRNIVYQKLLRIRDFRNRVYHNEPIIFGRDTAGNPTFDLIQARLIYSDIRDFFQWLDLDFDKWTKRINNINFEIERAECIMHKYPTKKYYFMRIFLGIKHYKTKYTRYN